MEPSVQNRRKRWRMPAPRLYGAVGGFSESDGLRYGNTGDARHLVINYPNNTPNLVRPNMERGFEL